MKKTILLLAFPLALTACGGGGPEDDAQKMCDMMKDWKTAKDAGNDEEADKIRKEGRAFGEEIEKKYKDDKAAMETLDKTIEECEDKYTK
jgi:hypothetical protein